MDMYMNNLRKTRGEAGDEKKKISNAENKFLDSPPYAIERRQNTSSILHKNHLSPYPHL
jgi:hypothetical protein